MQICKLGLDKIQKVSEFVWKVFSECDLPDYTELGVKTFKYFIEPEHLHTMVDKKHMYMLGAYEGRKLVGIIAMRQYTHISLLFVDPEFHRRKIATNLINCAFFFSRNEMPNINRLTVNASPYGKPAYLAMGFTPLDKEIEKEGMRYTPMRLEGFIEK